MQSGSPPQVRGKHDVSIAHRKLAGITPAGAGKTLLKVPAFTAIGDHPRRCGENCLGVSVPAVGTGSPPQVRGKPILRWVRPRRLRITPAGAGKTSKRNCSRRTRRDHPRRCGENVQAEQTAPYDIGSPPQVRGKPTVGQTIKVKAGITPAGAGKTDLEGCFRQGAWDHPRRCGENTGRRESL